MTDFVRNAWYVAAWDHEVTREPLGRIFLGDPVVLYRREDGTAVALEDRCCHRRFPLHRGTLDGDIIQCGYHGLRFDSAGRCVSVPGGGAVPAQLGQRAYPVVERQHWLWIWMGDPALADPDDIEDFHWLDDSTWGARGTRYHVGANYRLIIENLLDLTHLTYVHGSTIGNDAVAAADVSAEREGDLVRVTRWMIDRPAPPTYQKAGKFAGNIDRWQIIEYTAPGFIRLDVGGTPTGTGAPEGTRRGGIGMRNLNALTPETATSTHYFWAQAHDFSPNDTTITDFLFEQVGIAFNEDVAVFEAQQTMIDLDPARPVTNMPSDAGGVLALRLLDERLAFETAGHRAAE
jgi:phenylpropionate dioxygenase-like ring-hydroxylating dioxygenase large terminal subunit